MLHINCGLWAFSYPIELHAVGSYCIVLYGKILYCPVIRGTASLQLVQWLNSGFDGHRSIEAKPQTTPLPHSTPKPPFNQSSFGLGKDASDRASDSLCSPDYVVARVGRLKVQAGYDSAIQRPLPQAPQRFM